MREMELGLETCAQEIMGIYNFGILLAVDLAVLAVDLTVLALYPL